MSRGVAIITGGAGGIGKALLQRMRADGYTPVSWDLTDQVPDADLALRVDVTDETALAAAADRTATLGPPVTALVINAAVLGPVAPVWQIPAAEVRRVIGINLIGGFLTAQAVVPHMLRNAGPDRGRIVMIASVQGKEGTASGGPYAASKAGLIGLTKVLGKDLAQDGILVNAITPAVVHTPMLNDITAERKADLLNRIPLGRFLDPAEVAAMVAWLCGPDCSFSTGAVFDISGGRATY